jgi:hypothetical protein
METFPFDQQQIKSVSWADDQCSYIVGGKSEVELIEVQYVNTVPWFICWGKESKLIAALNSSQIESVVYI